jgi:predicted secreted hydrolase
MRRRALLLAACAAPAAAEIEPARALVFPRDHGAHLDARTEWWYATGWRGSEAAPTHGFQVTFFRSRTGLAERTPGRFAARHVLFAHAALTDLGARHHGHAQRMARWSGDAAGGPAHASTVDADLRLGGWTLRRAADGRYAVHVAADGITLDLVLRPTQPLLLQGHAGLSRKGPLPEHASRYYSEPQLAVESAAGSGRAWLDREWSDAYLAPQAVGWDWIGFNTFDGGALMAFRIRRADGSTLWAGGSWRAAGQPALDFGADAVRFVPGRTWASPATQARYPVQWRLETPAGRFAVEALLDGQELDSRTGTGTVYWEGLSELRDEGGRRIGLGYLEMTGYAGRLRMG